MIFIKIQIKIGCSRALPCYKIIKTHRKISKPKLNFLSITIGIDLETKV